MSVGQPHITLVRHGETAWSKAGRHTGRTDLPLTPEGERRAAALRERFRGVTFAAVWSSPLGRARRTAELAGFTPEPDPDLLEWDYGEYEGLTGTEVRARRPGWHLFSDGAPGGESVAAVSARADRVVGRIRTLAGPVLLFSHGHFLRVLAARWIGQPAGFARHLLLGTGAVSALDFDHNNPDEPAIALWNDDPGAGS